MTHTPTRLLLIGAGPRAVGILERLVANHDGTPLHIDLVDPQSPGAGRIWRYEQSELLLMNSRAEDVTIFTDDSFTGD